MADANWLSGIVLIVGVATMLAGGIGIATLLLWSALHSFRRQVLEGHAIWWVREAIEAYKKVKPPKFMEADHD